ncbi:hypothetical protein [Clostridium tertium]|uniref:hypothetical protein n=1 Tax=Clostridium tertium TaxID=1559 RepID=UPI0023B249CA|nr:hypothetical protein [Clostridium tertium]
MPLLIAKSIKQERYSNAITTLKRNEINSSLDNIFYNEDCSLDYAYSELTKCLINAVDDTDGEERARYVSLYVNM